MTNIYILNCLDIDLDEVLNSNIYIPYEINNKLINAKSITRKKELLATCIILSKVFNNDYDIHYYSNGKPYLDNKYNYLDYKYLSISHSNNIVSIALSEHDIGLDIEVMNKDRLIVHKATLNNYELDIYNSLNDYDKIKYFYKIWTRKEAYVKLSGIGLITKPNQITINNDFETIYKKVFNKDITLSISPKDIININEILTN